VFAKDTITIFLASMGLKTDDGFGPECRVKCSVSSIVLNAIWREITCKVNEFQEIVGAIVRAFEFRAHVVGTGNSPTFVKEQIVE